jgi:lipoate-protein ligase A
VPSEEAQRDATGPLGAWLGGDEDRLRRGLPSVRVTPVTERSVSIGVATPSDAPFVRRAREAGWPVVRRRSGGSGVLHLPGDLVWSVVLPRADPRVGPDFVRAFGRFGAGAVRFLSGRGVTGRWGAAPGLAPEYCVLSARGEVLSVGDRVLGGAAQHATARALLHHGTIARRVDLDALARLFEIRDPDRLDRLTGLEELGMRASPADLADELASALESELGPLGVDRSGRSAGA